MKALVLTGPKKLEVRTISEPVPDGDHVIIKVSACGICGSDLHFWESGTGMGGAADMVLGHEFCGVVTDPGSRKDIAAGDRVTALPIDPCGECAPCLKGFPNLCQAGIKRQVPGSNSQGAFAEYLKLRCDMVRKIPDAIDDNEACLIEPAAVALRAVCQSLLGAGDSVLIVGGGPIGLLCAVWARIRGASFIALSDINPARISKAQEGGTVDIAFNPLEPEIFRRLKKESRGGFDAAIETSASDAGMNSALSALKWHGRLVLAGISFRPQSVMTILPVVKELELRSTFAYTPLDFDETITNFAEKKLRLHGLVTGTAGLEQGQESFEELYGGKTSAVKIILKP